MPVDMDPSGIIPKIRHVMRTREDITRQQVRSLAPDMDEIQEARVQTLLEIASSLQLIYKTVNHMFLTAKKQNNYPLILPLQMVLPVCDGAGRIHERCHTGIQKGRAHRRRDRSHGSRQDDDPHGGKKQQSRCIRYLQKDMFEGRNIIMIQRQRGPAPVVGRPADALLGIIQG